VPGFEAVEEEEVIDILSQFDLTKRAHIIE